MPLDTLESVPPESTIVDCGAGCQTCNGATGGFIIDDPFAMAKGTTHQLNFYANYNTGGQYNETTISNWSSDNTPVATVDNNKSRGMVTAVSVGSATMGASALNLPFYASQVCGGANCPIGTLSSSSPGCWRWCTHWPWGSGPA